jgi:Domain of unknown function (DUF6894)
MARCPAMPRFYFHVGNGNGFTEDEEGRELPDLESARAEAIRAARDIMASDVRSGALDLSSFIEIEDADHRLRHTLSFEDAVDLTQRH